MNLTFAKHLTWKGMSCSARVTGRSPRPPLALRFRWTWGVRI